MANLLLIYTCMLKMTGDTQILSEYNMAIFVQRGII